MRTLFGTATSPIGVCEPGAARSIKVLPRLLWSVTAVIASALLLLLLTVESSLQPSIIFNRGGAWWTPWLYKIGPISVADIIIILITGYTLIVLLIRAFNGGLSVYRSAYLPLVLIACSYLGIGLFYNLVVYSYWKTFLYDFKAILYLTVPYLFLAVCADRYIRSWFVLPWIFVYLALANLIDFGIVTIFGRSEYPSIFGVPSIPPLVPVVVSIAGFVFSRKTWQRVLFGLLFMLEIFISINRISLGSLFNASVAVGIVYLLRVRAQFVGRLLVVAVIIIGSNLAYLLLVTNPFDISLIAAKTEGSLTRVVQMQNVYANFGLNIPGWIGKGLGSTWFELIPIPQNDIYSVGTSVGRTSGEAMASPVKFVFNLSPAAIVYKWGALGLALLCVGITWYYHTSLNRVRALYVKGAANPLLFPALVISVVYVIENFTYIGNLKAALVTSLLVFFVENGIREMYRDESGDNGRIPGAADGRLEAEKS